MIRGADAVIRTLVAAGTKTIFTLSGNHIMPLFDATIGQPVRLVHTRHEAAAVHMADAFARMTGTVGVAAVTGGPGHANAVGALYTALAGETPLLLLSGHAPLAEAGRGAFQEIDQAAMAAPVAKASWTVSSAAALAEDIARALRIARAGRPGPVHLSLPVDLLDAMVEATAPPDFAPPDFAPPVQALAAADVARLAAALRAASRPLAIVPPALCTASGKERLAALAALGVPVVPMQSPRGRNDPALGDLGAVLGAADCLLLLGKQLDFTLDFGRVAAAECRWLVIEPEAAMLARAQAARAGCMVAVQADPAAAIEALIAEGPVPVDPAWRQFVAERLSRRARPAAGRLDSASLCAALGDFLATHEAAILVADGGEIGQWAQALVTAGDRLVNGVAGAIGAAIPFAIGARAACPDRPVLAVSGDGAFGFHMAEFETAIRHDLPFVAVIGNDARWNAEHQIQLRRYGAARAIGCDLGAAVRYDQVAAALGGVGFLIERAAEIGPALRAAFASRRPACVNVLIEGLPAPATPAAPGRDEPG